MPRPGGRGVGGAKAAPSSASGRESCRLRRRSVPSDRSRASLASGPSNVDSDNLDCRPELEQRIHLNANWRDARPPGITDPTLQSVDKPGCGRGASLWAAGTLDYGRVPGSGLAAGSRFGTPGLSAGIDLVPWSGVRSGMAVDFLKQAGFRRVKNLVGGILRWSDDVDPTVPKY